MPKRFRNTLSHVTKTALFWAGPFLLLSLVDAGAGPAGAAQGVAVKKSAPLKKEIRPTIPAMSKILLPSGTMTS